jgi:hypothetical protein
MSTIEEIDSLTRRTRSREFDDGLMDLVYGMVFLILSLANWFIFSTSGLEWLATALIQQREISLVALLGLLAAFLLAIHGMRQLVWRIRRSYLWKDSGMVKPLLWQVSRPVVFGAVAVVIALIVGATWLMASGVLTEEQALRALPASIALGTAVTYLGMGIDLRIRRYSLVGAAGLGLAAIVLIQSSSFSAAWLTAGVGLMAIMSSSGLWALRQSVLRLSR